LFATLKMLVANGMSVIFISHKLHEVMAVSDRVVVLRGGRVAGARDTAGATRQELAALMVGQEVTFAPVAPVERGAELFSLQNVSTAPRAGGSPLDCVTLSLH